MKKTHRLVSRAALWFLGMLMAATVGVGPTTGATVSWVNTSGTNDWFGTNNWSTTNVPAAGDDVIINYTNVSVLLTNSTAPLASILLSNQCTLIFSNWSTLLNVSNGTITIGSNAVLTLPGAFTNNVMSNRVWIICSNLSIASGGSINAEGKGYGGADGYYGNGNGPGGGIEYTDQMYCSGAGHGGRGGWMYYTAYLGVHMGYQAQGGGTYDSSTNPVEPGSGGGGTQKTVGGSTPGDRGGNGGGVIIVQASGIVTVNGTVSANGTAGNNTYAGGGSGGSISITCAGLAGTNGVIQANGGNPAYSGNGGAGGGGRIAVSYNLATQSGMAKPAVRFLAKPGFGVEESSYGWGFPRGADLGTLALSGYDLLNETGMNHVVQVVVPGASSWSVNSLTVTDAWLRFTADGFNLTVTNDLTVAGGGATMANTILEFGSSLTNNEGPIWERNLYNRYGIRCFNAGPALNVGNNLILTNNGALYLGFGATNMAGADYEVLLSVTNAMLIGTNSWVYLYSNPTNGLSPFIRVGSLQIANANCGIDAAGRGFGGGGGAGPRTNGYGNGGGGGLGSLNYYAGGGHGGAGGNSALATGGSTYGLSNAPTLPGSGGGGGYPNDYNGTPPGAWGGPGGGVIRISATQVTMNGTLTANGGVGGGVYYGGGGAGGAIWINCRSLAGTGAIRANGGLPKTYPAGGGGGGGGRIAVWRMYDTSGGSSNATATGAAAGAGRAGSDGTVVWGQIPLPGTIFSFH